MKVSLFGYEIEIAVRKTKNESWESLLVKLVDVDISNKVNPSKIDYVKAIRSHSEIVPDKYCWDKYESTTGKNRMMTLSNAVNFAVKNWPNRFSEIEMTVGDYK